tara:strand:- start:947 stop:1147 length:201 start_codon:yes stop_codon:yes gene_type:complete
MMSKDEIMELRRIRAAQAEVNERIIALRAEDPGNEELMKAGQAGNIVRFWLSRGRLAEALEENETA